MCLLSSRSLATIVISYVPSAKFVVSSEWEVISFKNLSPGNIMVIPQLSAKFGSFTSKSISNECDTLVPFFGNFTKISGGVLSTENENVFSVSYPSISRAKIRKLCSPSDNNSDSRTLISTCLSSR